MRETPGPPDPKRLRAIIEALVFAAEDPLMIDDLIDVFPGCDRETLTAALDDVSRACEAEERGVAVRKVAGGYRMTTKSDLGEWVRALFRSRNRRRLSSQALETLAIVAYRQPITTPEIQSLRGLDPSAVLEALLEKKLVRIVGRKKVVGKPFLYGTTPEFLAHFGLNTLEDLPDAQDLTALLGPLAARSSVPTEEAAERLSSPERGPFEEEGDDGGNGEDTTEEDEDDENERGDDGDDS